MSAIKKLTGVGGDIRQIAALLQSKGRRGDSILAHITPREAALLRAQGGSGTTNPETGLQEFYEFDFGTEFGTAPMDTSQFDFAQAPATESLYADEPFAPTPERTEPLYADEPFAPQVADQVAEPDQGRTPDIGAVARAVQAGVSKPGPSRTLADLASLARAVKPLIPTATAVGATALGARAARDAQREAEQYRLQQDRIAAPYRTRGQQMIGAAERGELTPVNRQQLEAARAQLAQQVQGRGGVGAMQATEQIARMQQTLLQNQYDYGLKLANLGDQIAIGAIKTGMQADKEMRDLMQRYMTGAARIAGGSSEILGNETEQTDTSTATRRK
jgi:hypothetical protein